jgi:hypothetical protein
VAGRGARIRFKSDPEPIAPTQGTLNAGGQDATGGAWAAGRSKVSTPPSVAPPGTSPWASFPPVPVHSGPPLAALQTIQLRQIPATV